MEPEGLSFSVSCRENVPTSELRVHTDVKSWEQKYGS